MNMNPTGFDPSILVTLVKMQMPFGKYKGRVLCDLPLYYLNWFKQKGFPKGKLGMYLETLYEIKLNGLDYLLVPLRNLESKPKQEGYYYTDKKVLKAKFEGKSTEAVFEKIHQENFWENSDSVSGPGSGLEQTATIRSALPELWKRYDIRSILDIPCGDFFWMKEMDLSNITYTGGDIVSKIIEKNKQEYEREGISFRKMNLILSELPKVDLVLCRDCLVHFSFADIGEAIANLKKSQSTWLLTTHFEENRRNNDIITGDWRPLNLCNRPFHFPEPEAIINEQCTELDGSYSDKSLALWRIADL